MLQIRLLCIGKCKERYWREACAEYQKRLGGFCKLEVTELPECRADNPNPARIVQVLETEGEAILSHIPANAYVIALCIEGNSISSDHLAQRLGQLAVGGNSRIVLVIGGSHGLSPAVKKRANFRLSFSSMTFPHQLARVMMLEQLYRSFTILAGTRYHK